MTLLYAKLFVTISAMSHEGRPISKELAISRAKILLTAQGREAWTQAALGKIFESARSAIKFDRAGGTSRAPGQPESSSRVTSDGRLLILSPRGQETEAGPQTVIVTNKDLLHGSSVSITQSEEGPDSYHYEAEIDTRRTLRPKILTVRTLYNAVLNGLPPTFVSAGKQVARIT